MSKNNDDFPNDVREMMDFAIKNVAKRAARVDWAKFVLQCVLKPLIHMLRAFRLEEQGDILKYSLGSHT